MARKRITVVVGRIWEEEEPLTLSQLCRACDVTAETVAAMIEEGILDPEGRSPREWRFAPTSVERVHKVLRLQQDLRLNLPGAALALTLMDRIERLRARLRARGG